MTVTWEIETQIIPQFFDKNRGYLLEGLLAEGRDFFCDNFNGAFEVYYENGEIKEKIKYEPYEFYVTAKTYGNINRMIYIELPEPRKSDFSYNMYTKCYCIPYRLKNDGIEIFDMYGIDTVKDIDVGFIIWYKDAQHLMSNLKLPVSIDNREELINFMHEYIFSRLNKNGSA